MGLFSTSIDVDGQTAIASVPRRSKAWRKANCVYVPVGRAYSQAYILLTRLSVTLIEGSEPHTINWRQTGNDAKLLQFQGFYLINAERVMMGGPEDGSALYLCEFADARYLLQHTSDSGTINANIRSYAQDNDYLNGTTGYTWATLAQELWNDCGLLGTFPGLPYSPDGIPNNTRFQGTNAWNSLCALLDHLDCAVVHNPLANSYSIVQLGAAQTIPTLSSSLKFDGDPVKPYIAAATVRCYFKKYFRSYGQEQDTELDNWSVDDVEQHIDTATGIANGHGVIGFWEDLVAELDEDNVITAASSTAIAARAAAKTARYVLRRTVTANHRIHIGVQNAIVCGPRVKAVLWRNWDDSEADLGGTVTEFVSGPDMPAQLDAPAEGAGLSDAKLPIAAQENYLPPDLARPSYPNYPRLPNIVQVYHSGATQGQMVDANADGFHPGFVRRFVANAMETLEECWIRFVDDHDSLEGNLPAKDGDLYGAARLSGVSTSGGDRRPVYTVRRGELPIIHFELDEDLMLGGEADAYILSLVGGVWTLPVGDPDIIVVDWYTDPGMWQSYQGCRGLAVHREDNRYDIIWMETIARWIRYTLNETLTAGSAECTVNHYHLQGKNPDDYYDPVTVHDPLDTFAGWHQEGCQGWAHWNDRALRYEITTPELVSMFAWATLKYATCGSGAEVENVTYIQQGYYKSAHIVTPTVVNNPRGHSGKVGDAVLIMASGNSDPLDWEIVDVDLHLVTVVTDVRIDGYNFQKKRHDTYVEICDDETAWTTYHTGADCNVSSGS